MRAFTLGCCLAAAVTLAFSVNQVVRAVLSEAPLPTAVRSVRTPPTSPALDRARLARLLNTELRPAVISAPRRPLPLKLLGTLDDHAASLLDSGSARIELIVNRAGARLSWSLNVN